MIDACVNCGRQYPPLGHKLCDPCGQIAVKAFVFGALVTAVLVAIALAVLGG